MKRTCQGRSRVRLAKSAISSSFLPRIKTTLTLIGSKPTRSAASIPAMIRPAELVGNRDPEVLDPATEPVDHRAPSVDSSVRPCTQTVSPSSYFSFFHTGRRFFISSMMKREAW